MTAAAGSGLLINSRVLHRFETDRSIVIPNVVYSPFLLGAEDSLIYQKYFLPFLIGGPACIVFDPAVGWQASCIQQMRELFTFSGEMPRTSSERWCCCSVSGASSAGINR